MENELTAEPVKKKQRSCTFEKDPLIRKRLQNRLLRKLRETVDEFASRIGQQAVVLVVNPGNSKSNFQVFGSQPLENVVGNLRTIVMQELKAALDLQLLSPVEESPSLFKLPPLMIDNIPTPLEKMTQVNLRAFIPLMLKYSTGRNKPGWGNELTRPPWWPTDIPWQNIRMDTRDKDKKETSWTNRLRQIVINCYKYHEREDLLHDLIEEEDEIDVDDIDKILNNLIPDSIVDGTITQVKNLVEIQTQNPDKVQNINEDCLTAEIVDETSFKNAIVTQVDIDKIMQVELNNLTTTQEQNLAEIQAQNPDQVQNIVEDCLTAEIVDETSFKNAIVTQVDIDKIMQVELNNLTTTQEQNLLEIRTQNPDQVQNIVEDCLKVEIVNANSVKNAMLTQDGKLIFSNVDGNTFPVSIIGDMITEPIPVANGYIHSEGTTLVTPTSDLKSCNGSENMNIWNGTSSTTHQIFVQTENNERQFYHKWVPINAGTQDKKPGIKGYLKIDVGVLTKGEVPRFPVVADNFNDEIEGNLLLPDSVLHDRFRANYIFVVYHADEIPKVKSIGANCKKIIDCSDQAPSTYVQVSFAGLTGKTNVRKNTQNPVWNEKIILTELFPSLCQRIKIELKYTQHISPVVHYIYLKSICNDGENGFLPTFGPSFIYLYSSEYSGAKYNGKLLFEMRTEILTDLMWSSNAVDVQPVRQIPNLRLWPMEQILLFCTIYSVNMMDKKLKDKQISFEISMGRSITDSTDLEFISFPIKPVADIKKKYCYLPFQGKAISIFIVSKLEDLRSRIYNMNMMKKIYNLLKKDLEQVEILFEEGYKKNKEEISSFYLKIAEKLEKNCRIYLKISKNVASAKVELDEKKFQLCIKEIKDIEANISNTVHQENRKKVFRELLKYLYTLHTLLDNVLYCWPDIIIWMLSGNNRIGYYRLPVRDVIFSTKFEETGLLCGTFQNIYIKPTKKSKLSSDSAVICRILTQIWIGLYKEQEKCLNIVPRCFVPLEMLQKYKIPKTYKCKETRYATCKVYLYQGRFEPGADASGLSDPYVQVILNEHILQTKAVPKSIHPLWNETLIFKNITIHGSLEFITNHLPSIILEAYDQDAFNQNEFVGRCDLIPEISSNEKRVNLRWVKFFDGDKCTGEILTAAEIILFVPTGGTKLSAVCSTVDTIPENIKPHIKSYRLDVYFWGVHDLKPLCLIPVTKPKITIECGGTTLQSTTLQNTKKYLNFSKPYQSVFVNIPDETEYYPPLSINMFDCRGFGWYVYVGTYLGKLQDFKFKPLTSEERVKLLTAEYNHNRSVESSATDDTGSILQPKDLLITNDLTVTSSTEFNIKMFKMANQYLHKKLKKQLIQKQDDTPLTVTDKIDIIDIDTMDWWTKFYISTEHAEIYRNDPMREKLKITIYPCELESVEEFDYFNDLLHTFNLYRGKRTGDDILDAENIVAVFKGAIRIYQWPPEEEDTEEYVTEAGYPLHQGSFLHYPVNEPVAYVARVYVIRAFNLRPKDLSGKSDPYLVVKLGDKEIVDKENYVPKEVNPVFGRCFELRGSFPNDNLLTISVWDYDLSTTDDLIGETKLDLENRLYTNHRANCGLPIMYIEQGPCAWRDQYKPSQILKILCKRNKLGDPEFYKSSVKIGYKIFKLEKSEHKNEDVQMEILSLFALNHWKEIPLVGCTLVPEHVETRSLYHYSKPGLEQGKLQMWVDIFPSSDYPPPPPVDVKPRAPISYELRIIVWNTMEVILNEDDFFIGEKKSDIYVKGWLNDPEDSQCTDVHYNSISGEGNFNWRLIFQFLYLIAEDKIVVKNKGTLFSEGSEVKLPCFLNLQVWDNDNFNPDDFLGSLRLSLTHLPRGAKTSKLCSLSILKSGAPTINLFKTKRHKGWWPFLAKEDKKHKDILAGKVELEFQLLTEDECRLYPAGLGRSDPQGLPVPKRPDMSFSWFTNPLKALKFLLCKRFRAQFVLIILFGILFFIGFVAIYSFPKYLVKRIVGA